MDEFTELTGHDVQWIFKMSGKYLIVLDVFLAFENLFFFFIPVTYSKSQISQIAVFDYFLTSTLKKNTLFQFPEYAKQL